MVFHRHARKLGEILTVGAMTLVVLGLVAIQSTGPSEILGLDGSLMGTEERSLEELTLDGVMIPPLEARVGAETGPGESIHLRGCPVSASLWLAPIASVASGAGLGWCDAEQLMARLRLDDPSPDTPSFRVRLGGGLMAPLTPTIGVDLRGRS